MSAVIYSRISDDPRGQAAGVERQAEECQALAIARGIDVLEVIVDNDISASSGKRRPGFDRVLELIEARQIDTVVTWHTDRLYRLPRDLEPLIALAEARKLRFLTVTASEIDLNNSSGRMVARMLAAASAQEVEHKAERQRSASDQRAARGLPTSRPGYGFRREGDALAVHTEEAEVLREAAQRVLAGESMNGIAADLNRRGIPSPSEAQAKRQLAASQTPRGSVTKWTGAGIRKALARPSVAGLRVHRGEIVGEAQGDAILDRGTWDRLTALFNDPARAPNKLGRGPRHLLSGIALCGKCGAVMYRMIGWEPKPHNKSTRRIPHAYACRECLGVRRSQAPVDELVTEVILARLQQPDAAALFNRGDDRAWVEAREQIEVIDAQLANAADAWADDEIDRAQLARISATLHAKKAVHEETLRRTMPAALPTGAVGPLARQTWSVLSIDQRRALIRALVEVTIHPAGAGKRKFDPATVQITWRTEPEA